MLSSIVHIQSNDVCIKNDTRAAYKSTTMIPALQCHTTRENLEKASSSSTVSSASHCSSGNDEGSVQKRLGVLQQCAE